MTFIWSTRGRTWGFQFLRSGGSSDPFVDYTNAFTGIEHEHRAWRRAGGVVALRFPDPKSRRDEAGRIIPQEFVVFGDLADRIGSVEDGIDQIWPEVASQFQQIWDQPSATFDQTQH